MSKLWDHQQRALDQLAARIAAGATRVCITAPTGAGKSRILYEDITQHGLSTAVYTDRRMLLDQLCRGLDAHNLCYGVRAAGTPPRLLDAIQLCSLQTEVSRSLKGERELHLCKRAYIDEAHKNSADTAQQIAEKHLQDGAVLIGLTATPLGIGHMYDELIVAGTPSELRKCGALLPAYHYGPDEPDTKWVGQVKIGEGECGLQSGKRMEFAKRVYGRVVEHYERLNPEHRPAVLFAPGVAESLWFARMLSDEGIRAAHIDGGNVWVDGERRDSTTETREEIAERSRDGDIKIICNRFVLREGIDFPWLYHGILATVFGSLTSYLQACGRLLRAYPSMDKVIIQDHGGNWWRHGSINADRNWELGHDDRIVNGMRAERIRGKKEQEPIVCPRCHAIRLSGRKCHECGHEPALRSRVVLQQDGSLREMRGDIFRQRRIAKKTQDIEKAWCSRVAAVLKSKKVHVQQMTFNQLEVSFARDHNWQYPPRDLPMMPIKEHDWYKPVKDVQELTR